MKKVVQAYIYTDQKEKAVGIYNNFLERKDYDPKFKKLKQIEKWLETK